MLKNTDWHYPAPIYFGEGRIKEIGRLCHSLEMTDPLIITDTNLKDMPFCLTLLESLEKENITYRIFTDFSPNPTDLNIHAGNETFNQRKHDGIIVLGGGSAIDVAKTIALTAGQSHPLWDFEDVGDNYLRADTNKIIKTIAIPTTAGTGSEVGRASVIVDTQAQTKRLIFHPLMLPKAVILDPSTTLTVPPHLTAATGMDAFAHSLEAFLAPTFHPMSNGIALEGMRLIKENLPKAYQDGSNIEARGNLLIASTMGATAFQKGLGLIHSLSHPVGAMYHQHHGLLNALFMPYSLLFNRSHIEAHATIIARHLSYG
jgi:alcohol dehydrogenase class IV